MKLYVGTYGKYNNGSIDGEWLDLNDFESIDEFYEKCHEIHQDENDPEFMFQDYEADEEWESNFYSECSISPVYWELQELKNEYGEDYFNIYMQYMDENSIEFTKDNLKDTSDRFLGLYQTREDFVESSIENDIGKIPNYIRNYIDLSKMANDWELCDYSFLETNQYWRDYWGCNKHYIAVFYRY